MSSKRILIVDDSEHYLASFFEKLGVIQEVSSIVLVTSSAHFLKVWENDQDFNLIYMDACLDSDELDTIPLINKIRETSQCPIVASTSIDTARKKMLLAGCNYEFTKLQFNEAFIEQFKQILNI